MISAVELREWRVKLGHSQASLASLLGLSTRHYVRYELGQAEIPVMLPMAMRVVPSRLSERKRKQREKK